MTHTLESLMRLCDEYADSSWNDGHEYNGSQCSNLSDETAAKRAALESALAALVQPQRTVDIVFDGPPSHKSGRFVEVESPPGKSIRFGEWVERDGGLWALRFNMPSLVQPQEPVAHFPIDELERLKRDGMCLVFSKERPAHRFNWAGTMPLYAAPAAQEAQPDLLRLVDMVWQHATESLAVPSHQIASELIRKASGGAPPFKLDESYLAAQEARPACDNRGSSYHVDGDPIARGEAPEPVAQPDAVLIRARTNVEDGVTWYTLTSDLLPGLFITARDLERAIADVPLSIKLLCGLDNIDLCALIAGQPAQSPEERK